MKRAITLAGGGPSAGLHIGALMVLEEKGIEFDIWSLSCIGAWVGIVYNTREEPKAQKTYEFFRDHVFRDDATYEWFPINRAFGPNTDAFAQAWLKFLLERWTLDKLVDLPQMFSAWLNTTRVMPWQWRNPAVRNAWLLNDVLAVLPATRYLTGLAFLSDINGLANIHYKDSPFLKEIGIKKLRKLDKVEIYHNAWDVGEQRIQLFHNHPEPHRARGRDYQPISDASLCACSALPYVEQTVKVDKKEYSEGALIDTVNFRNLIEDHRDLDQIWINRIVDPTQARSPQNLHDGLANLCQLFAGEVGQSDISLFRHHARKSARRMPRVVDIPIIPRTEVGFEWKTSNLDRGVDEGYRAACAVLTRYPELLP